MATIKYEVFIETTGHDVTSEEILEDTLMYHIHITKYILSPGKAEVVSDREIVLSSPEYWAIKEDGL